MDWVDDLVTERITPDDDRPSLSQTDTATLRETALREILDVISRSRDDEKPVFDAILENASRLCDAPLAFLSLVDDARTIVTVPASRGARVEFSEILEQFAEPVDRCELIAVGPIVNGEIIRMDDIADDDLYRDRDPRRIQMVEIEGVRSVVAVPLQRGNQAIGAIILYRREVWPFSADDVSLLQSFAVQAVIAIENTRQFRELETRLEREAATREILEVISTSRDDDAPVFDVILETATRLCNAPFACLFLANDDRTSLSVVASNGTRSKFVDLINREPLPMDAEQSLTVQSMVAKKPLQISDAREDEIYKSGQPHRVHAVDIEGVRTLLCVPLITGGKAIGVIFLYRREVALFSDGDLALLETFAAQAVIAIENVRQFRALESLNEELGDRVEEQVDEIERMGRLKRFLPAAVADTVLSRGSEKMLSSHRALLGVLFCDIRGFTAFCETAEPEETIEVLQTYHEEMGKLINAHGAGVDHRMGDGIMVLFNDPLPCDDPAGDAVRLALAMRQRMAKLCERWKRLGHRLGFGVGISLGYATVGMVGYEGRYDYTASGTSVNLAARLCDQAEDGEILLSPRAYTAIEDDYKATSIGEADLKGIREPVEVFSLLDVKDESSMES
jgi:class 3 adenylate cyclase